MYAVRLQLEGRDGLPIVAERGEKSNAGTRAKGV